MNRSLNRTPNRSLNLFALQTLAAVAVAASFFAAPEAGASIIAAPSLFYRSQHVVDNTGSFSNIEDRYTIFDLRGAYRFDDLGLTVGALLKYETDTFLNGDTRGLAIGPTVGFTKDAFSVMVTYFLSANKTFNVGGAEKKLMKGKGFQIDLAWTPEVVPGFGLGPQLSWQSLRYDSSKIGTSDETGNGYEDSTVLPGIALWWVF